MKKSDPFTQRRLIKFIETFREKNGQLPTLQDCETAGFDRAAIDQAVKDGRIEMVYVTLTNGTIVKGMKVAVADPFS